MYTIYHIPGIKVGCSKRVEARVKEQGYDSYEVLEVCDTVMRATERERYWQEKLNYKKDLCNYATTLISSSQHAIAKFKQTIKTSEIWKESQQKNINRFTSPETRSLLDEARKKPILQYDKQGNFIKEWPGLINAANALNTTSCLINAALRGRTKTSRGFIWKYKNV